MNSRIKAAILYIDSNQVAKASGGSMKQASGGERQFGATDVVGHSDGIKTTDVSFDQVNTVDGGGPALRRAYENNTDVKVKIATIDGNTYTGFMRITGIDDKWTGKDGSNMGTFTLEGGKLDRS